MSTAIFYARVACEGGPWGRINGTFQGEKN